MAFLSDNICVSRENWSQPMEISKPGEGYLDTTQLHADLKAFLSQPGPAEHPPCPNCANHIPSQCSASCTQAPAALSIDPEQHPIEENMVPLVFELMSTNVLRTCWSCEGHSDSNGEIWRMPNVSFYSKSMYYPQLLLKHLVNLKYSGALHYTWQIVLADYGQTSGVTFCIQPDMTQEDYAELEQLQTDLKTIADNMLEKLKDIARQMIKDTGID